MSGRVLLSLFVWMVCLVGPALAGPADERRELWTGSVLTSSYRVGLCVAPSGEARGVLLLRSLWGREDVYHLYGTVRGEQIDLRHGSGHRILARYAGGKVKGQAFLRQGKKFALDARRTLDAALTRDDCRPLP